MTCSAESVWVCMCFLACVYISVLLLHISSFILCSAATQSILKLLSQWKVANIGNDCPGGKADCVRKSGCLQLASSVWPQFEPSLFRLFESLLETERWWKWADREVPSAPTFQPPILLYLNPPCHWTWGLIAMTTSPGINKGPCNLLSTTFCSTLVDSGYESFCYCATKYQLFPVTMPTLFVLQTMIDCCWLSAVISVRHLDVYRAHRLKWQTTLSCRQRNDGMQSIILDDNVQLPPLWFHSLPKCTC